MGSFSDYFQALHPAITPGHIALAVGLSVGLLVACLGLALLVVVTWPQDHFLAPKRAPWADRHPALRGLLVFGKNLSGALLLGAGLVLALPGVPGPGFAVLFIGLTLIDFPGRRRMELWVLRKPVVHRAIDRIRARFRRERLILDEDDLKTV